MSPRHTVAATAQKKRLPEQVTLHRKTWSRHPRPLAERFWEKVDKTPGGCWTWTASLGTKGYGQISHERRPLMAHRVAYELTRGPIPDGLQIDHLCRNHRCVNPDHLEPVDAYTNLSRSTAPAMVAHVTDTCRRGHPLDEANTYWAPSNKGRRACRTCRAINDRKPRRRA